MIFHGVLSIPVALLRVPVPVLLFPIPIPSFTVLSLCFYLEDGGNRFLQNLSTYL
jgi:hypothetical protein